MDRRRINYGIAVSARLASYFYSWLERDYSLELLNLHLFIIYPDGGIEHKNPEEFLDFVRILYYCHKCQTGAKHSPLPH
jgi:hypothetical protein